MSDETQSNDQPQNADLEALVAQLSGSLDQRFQGFQGILDRRDAEYRQMIEDLKTADLSPEEQEQFRESKLQRELESTKRRLEIMEMRKEYPEEVDLLDSLLQGKSLTDQLNLLATFRKAQPSTESDESVTDEGQPTPVDKNNASRKTEPSLADFGGQMTPELADRLIDTNNEGGILRRLRRG